MPRGGSIWHCSGEHQEPSKQGATPMSFRLRTIASDRKVCDVLSLDLLARVIPPHVVDRVLTDCAAHQQRTRKLSQRAVVYLLVAVTLHGHLAIEDVIKRLWRSCAFL